MTTSIRFHIFFPLSTPKNWREQQEKTGDSLRTLKANKVFQRQDFLALAFHDEFGIPEGLSLAPAVDFMRKSIRRKHGKEA